ncbi:MAG: rod shape-determining protein MreD, partial [Paramuribaculum sp.]|nr:rod shape-determining protein MreD [Paramuribaculum sp.]
MNRTYTTILIWIPLLIVLQALVFNHICLFGYAVPFVFIYGLLRLPLSLSKERAFTIGFLTGSILDIFSDTMGLNALCCTLLMALRRPIARLYLPRDEDLLELIPGIKSYGIG